LFTILGLFVFDDDDLVCGHACWFRIIYIVNLRELGTRQSDPIAVVYAPIRIAQSLLFLFSFDLLVLEGWTPKLTN